VRSADARLNEVADSISTGSRVDWAVSTNDACDREEVEILENLQAVQRILYFHDQLHTRQARRDTYPTGRPREGGNVDADSGGEPPTAPQRIGAGASGNVYRAWDARLEREIAIKVLHLESGSQQARALHEGRLLARVRHPNVVTVYAADPQDDGIGLKMELIRGRTLQAIVEEEGPFAAREAILIGLDLCRALSALHGSHLIHRDLKAANVMREKGGRIVLMDLGAGLDVRNLDSPSEGSLLTGTPLYMAPELFRGADASVETDVYALGVLLYFLVTGSYPVIGRTLHDLVDAHDHGRSKLLRDERSDLPDTFVRVVERALAQSPLDRFRTVGALELALSASIGGVGTAPGFASEGVQEPASDLAIATSTVKRRSTYRLILLLTVVAVISAVALTVQWMAPVKPLVERADLYRTGVLGRPLQENDVLHPEDQFYAEVKGHPSLFFYLLAHDEAGTVTVLFPDPENSNPVAANTVQRFPRTGSWFLKTAGGRETILMIASATPLRELESALAALPVADSPSTESSPGGGGLLGELAGSQEDTRGLGRTVADKPISEFGPHLDPVLRKLRSLEKESGGRQVWTKAVVLRTSEQPR